MTVLQQKAPATTHPSWGVSIVAGLSTYLTLSYIFLLNPILLAKGGVPISAAYFGTVVSAALATLMMGLWANVPFAVAPAPSITTFFVSYVCIQLKLPWQAALAAVVLSGVLSVAMAMLSIRYRLITSIPAGLSTSVLFALSGFLIANGLSQAKVLSYSDGLLELSKMELRLFVSPDAMVLFAGLAVTLLFRVEWLKFAGAPLLGIAAAFLVASMLGIKAKAPPGFSAETFSAVGKLDFSPLFRDPRFFLAIVVFFVIDFFGGVGKYVGLFAAMGAEAQRIPESNMKKALYVDGLGNILGGVFGASSLAVFVSSAVGIVAGGRTGRTAVVTAVLMLASLLVMPLVGAIPAQATSGILVFVGLLLARHNDPSLNRLDKTLSVLAALVAFLTYKLDMAMLLVFLVYSGLLVYRREARQHAILIAVTALLLLAVVAQ